MFIAIPLQQIAEGAIQIINHDRTVGENTHSGCRHVPAEHFIGKISSRVFSVPSERFVRTGTNRSYGTNRNCRHRLPTDCSDGTKNASCQVSAINHVHCNSPATDSGRHNTNHNRTVGENTNSGCLHVPAEHFIGKISSRVLAFHRNALCKLAQIVPTERIGIAAIRLPHSLFRWNKSS